jgi:thiosulfate reductase cytochrome b subunit
MVSSSDVMAPGTAPRREYFYRHRLPTRITHWVTALAVFGLLMSGFGIFNAHPRLYWGHAGSNSDPAAFEMTTQNGKGVVRIGSLTLETDGVFGRSEVDGQTYARGFPAAVTLPGPQNLAVARRWHFFFAWVFGLSLATYFVFSIANGHLRRDLAPKKGELSPRHILHDIVEHAKLNFPKGEAAKRYNILQKIAYLGTLIGLLPVMILTGLTMSPGFNAIAPWLVTLFGGRQSARTIHFIAAAGIVAFILVHLIMVILAGPINEIRSMITGRFAIPPEKN